MSSSSSSYSVSVKKPAEYSVAELSEIVRDLLVRVNYIEEFLEAENEFAGEEEDLRQSMDE